MLALFQNTLRLIILIIGLTACATTPPTRFYLLEAISPPTAVQADGAKKYSIGLGPVSIPALLDRKQIVTRSDQNTVQIAELHQWAEPLRDNIARVLTQNLTVLQTHNVIRSYPWSAYGPVNYRVIIDIDRFDTQPGRSANLKARWAIRDEKTGTIATNEQTGIELPLADSSYPATAESLSVMLYELSKMLSLALDRLR